MSKYAFEGDTIKINHTHFKKIVEMFPNLNMDRQLEVLDMELMGNKNWWPAMIAKLNYRNNAPMHWDNGSSNSTRNRSLVDDLTDNSWANNVVQIESK